MSPFDDGAGKYNDECTALRESLHADAVVLIIAGGDKGEGFSVQAPLLFLLTLPAALRKVADQIEERLELLKP